MRNILRDLHQRWLVVLWLCFVVAALLWEITRHLLVWYFARLSQISVVYGSLTTAIVVLLSLEIGAALLLFGAQVISEYERMGRLDAASPPAPMRTSR